MDFIHRCDKSKTAFFEFAGIGDHINFAGDINHNSIQISFLGIGGGNAVLGIDPVNTEKKFVTIVITNGAFGHGAN